MQDRVIYAGTNNRVYVESAHPKPQRGKVRGSARDKENELLIARGKGDAGIDFDVEISDLYYRTNRLSGRIELYLIGDVDLDGEYRTTHDLSPFCAEARVRRSLVYSCAMGLCKKQGHGVSLSPQIVYTMKRARDAGQRYDVSHDPLAP